MNRDELVRFAADFTTTTTNKGFPMSSDELTRLHTLIDKREKNDCQTSALTFSELKELETLQEQYEREETGKRRWLHSDAN